MLLRMTLESTGRMWQELFQEQIHAVKINDAMTDEEQIHPQDSVDMCTALLEREVR